MSLPLRVSRIWAYGPTDDLCSESSELPPRSPTPPPSGRAGPRPGRHQTQPGSSSRPSTPEGSPRRELRSPLPPPAPSRADLAAADSPEDTFGTGDRSGDLRAAYNGLHAVVTRLQDADRRRTDISRVSTIVAVDTLECRVTLDQAAGLPFLRSRNPSQRWEGRPFIMCAPSRLPPGHEPGPGWWRYRPAVGGGGKKGKYAGPCWSGEFWIGTAIDGSCSSSRPSRTSVRFDQLQVTACTARTMRVRAVSRRARRARRPGGPAVS